MEIIIGVVAAIVALAVGIAVGWVGQRKKVEATTGNLQEMEKRIREEAERESKSKVKAAEIEAKELVFKTKADAEAAAEKHRAENAEIERRLMLREEALDKRIDQLDKRDENARKNEDATARKLKEAEERGKQVEEIIGQAKRKLEQVAGLTADAAKEQLIHDVEEEAKLAAARQIRVIEEQANEEAEKRAKRIMGIAIQRYAGEYVCERAISVVDLPNDEMKGRIIGREGRNIRAIEAAAGVDLIIDDTPETVVISAFDPVRREVARLTLEQLIADGRIHPARIEEMVEKMRLQVEASCKQAGEQALLEMGLHGIHPEIMNLVGRLRYRTSYTQNQWQHSIEVGFLAGAMAAELGLNIKLARRAGLLHDIGKALTHETDGSHAVVGAEFARKHGETKEIVHAIRSHHNDEEPETLLANLIIAADAISGARPGARREKLDSYIKRLEDLEKIAAEFKGVERAFAVQAGRELRVMVESAQINDDGIVILSRDIAKKIEADMTYPGQIKVTVIRETRASEFAR